MSAQNLEIESVPCELCGGRHAVELFVGRDRLLGIPGEFRVVKCQDCGLVYTDPRPTARSLAAYYPETYGVYAPEGGQADRMALYHRRIALRLNGSSSGAGRETARRVLDIGCGEGAFLGEMRSLGWQTTGLEMDRKAAERARSMRELEVVKTTVEEAEFEPEAFDLITLSHLLEHVPHPRATLRRAHGWLAKNGELFITLPNVDSWERRCFGKDWYPWDLPRHLYHFSAPTLGRLLEEEGFRVVDERRLNGLFVPQSIRYRLQRSHEGAGPPGAEDSLSERVAPQGGRREALKTTAFKALLAVASLSGRLFRGEILEVTARKAAP